MVKDKLIEAVEGIGIPCYYARTYPQEKSDYYVTFYCQSSEDIACFDNTRNITNWSFDVRYFDDNPERRENMKYTLRTALEGAGFLTDGIGWDIIKNTEQDKDGFVMTFDYLERL